MFDALSLLNARKNSGLLFVPAHWNYQEYRFAHDFLGCIAVDSLCTAVPRGDDPVEADADDRIIAEFHNGSEAPGPFLTLAQCNFGLASFNKIGRLPCKYIQ